MKAKDLSGRILPALALALLLALSCSGGGGEGGDGDGDSDGDGTGDETGLLWDLAGAWTWTYTIIVENTRAPTSVPVQITQSGTEISVDEELSGSYDGSSLRLASDDRDPGSGEMSMEIDLTIQSNKLMTGSGRVWIGGTDGPFDMVNVSFRR